MEELCQDRFWSVRNFRNIPSPATHLIEECTTTQQTVTTTQHKRIRTNISTLYLQWSSDGRWTPSCVLPTPHPPPAHVSHYDAQHSQQDDDNIPHLSSPPAPYQQAFHNKRRPRPRNHDKMRQRSPPQGHQVRPPDPPELSPPQQAKRASTSSSPSSRMSPTEEALFAAPTSNPHPRHRQHRPPRLLAVVLHRHRHKHRHRHRHSRSPPHRQRRRSKNQPQARARSRISSSSSASPPHPPRAQAATSAPAPAAACK